MIEITTFINDVAAGKVPAFIMAFWIILGLGILYATAQIVLNVYRTIKAHWFNA